ncbi:hypothetical protein MYXO_03214 [Myxococcaceae bacterium]|nr:hypothetical protein MYXO_03214 [Myxococcaceae bacterium]
MPPPLIDKRSFDELVARTEHFLQRYTDWRPGANGEFGAALVRVFAHLTGVAIDRLNRMPDKNFLAFLDLIGVELLPPQPARVPLTFHLAAGSASEPRVPARTRVAATLAEGETEPCVFETERELGITRSGLVAVFTREPGQDRYGEHTGLALGQEDGAFPAFQGGFPDEHQLYLGHALLGMETAKTITLEFTPADAALPWPYALEWAWWDGSDWRPVAASIPATVGRWQATLAGIPRIPERKVGEETSAWLRGQLRPSIPGSSASETDAQGNVKLRQQGLLPDAGFAGDAPRDFGKTVYPFGQITPRNAFYLACERAFSKPGAQLAVEIEADAAQPARPSPGLVLAWEYWDGNGWQELGRSSPGSDSLTASAYGFADKTRAFTQNGGIRFSSPRAWRSGEVQDVKGFWLRTRIIAGDYGPVADYHPPALQRLALGYEWPLPRIDRIRVGIDIQRAGLSADAAFANQIPVDLSKDFYPFGEKPRFNDAFYLACGEAFSKSGPDTALLTVTLAVDASDIPKPDTDNVTLTWEYWNGTAWSRIGASSNTSPFVPGSADYVSNLKDNTQAFTFPDGVSPTIVFDGPKDWLPNNINGQENHWLRVRIAKGNYGIEASYEPVIDPATQKPKLDPNTGLPIYQLVPANFRPPSLKPLSLGYHYSTSPLEPDHALTRNDFVTEDRTALAKTGDGRLFQPFTPMRDNRPTLYLGFQRPGDSIGFANRPAALYFGVAETLYGESPGEEGGGGPPAVVWEYWNGEHWNRLGTQDETQSFTRRGLVGFIGPSDFRASTEFDRNAFWLRARWDGGGYAFPPKLSRILTNTTWASHVSTLANEILGSSNGDPDQVFRTSKAPLLPGQSVEVKEPELPSSAEVAAIEREEGKDAITTGDIWIRWHAVPDFYQAGPRSRHYAVDRLTGEIRFGDGKRGLIPPQGRSNIRANYRTGGGTSGNRPVASLTQLKSAVPYVDRVSNVEPAGGGSAQETLEAVKLRGPKRLRHRDRAATIADYEDLAFEVSPEIARVKGLPARSSTDAGSVGLIVVPRSQESRPIPSLELLGRVEDYLAARLTPTVDIWVAGPDWLKVTVSAEIVPLSLEGAADMQNLILARLAGFLHPLTGGLDGQGWAFGRKPYRSDLYAWIEGTPGVDHVRSLTVAEEGDIRPDRFLVYSGGHQVTLVGG